ncbi:MAG TPA: alpha/beta family hydrolase [Gemmatimonadota bacterium]|nr:alpha/beta family hydrolase [Gemmatimonadota bacterium]
MSGLLRPDGARWLLVLGHGAGAGPDHPFMVGLADRLAGRAVATFRYAFPYIEAGKRRPDPPGVLEAAVRRAVEMAAAAAPDLPILAGGKSLGGRMTSRAAAGDGLSGVRGLVFFGFPLHSPAKPGNERAAHLADVHVPMLFLQGTRDSLARLDLLRPVLEGLGDLSTLHVIEDADHGFHVPKRSGRTDDDVLDELAEVTAAWAARVAPA